MTPAEAEYGLWISAYADQSAPWSRDTVLRVFRAIQASFVLGRVRGCTGGERARHLEEPDSWLESRMREHQENGISIHLGGTKGGELMWHLWCSADSADGLVRTTRNTALFVGINLSLARDLDRIIVCIREVSSALMRDDRVWYGFVNCAPRTHVTHPVFYSGGGGWIDDSTWERMVEQARWDHFVLGTHDRVRGVFWGNILGPAFAQRVRDAGYYKTCEWLEEQYGHRPVTIEEPSTGSMVIMLDDDPVTFAKTRDTGEMDFGSMNRSVKTGALVWEIFSKADLL